MDRRTRALIVVGLATVLATAAAFGVYQAIQNRPVIQVPIAERFTVVAAKTVPVGTVLTNDMVRVTGWPTNAPVAGGFAKPEEVLGRGVTIGLVENEPIVETKLAPKGAGGGLAPVITPGMRAMAVRVNDVIGVAGFTLPGTRVDVIVTLRPGAESVSRIVISNVLVVSAGGNIDTNQALEGKATPNNAVVTLMVSPTDAERLALASTQGQIQLALRNPLDVAAADTTGARISGLFGAPAPEPVRPAARPARSAAPAAAPAPAPKPPSIEVITGTTRKEQIVKKCPEPGC